MSVLPSCSLIHRSVKMWALKCVQRCFCVCFFAKPSNYFQILITFCSPSRNTCCRSVKFACMYVCLCLLVYRHIWDSLHERVMCVNLLTIQIDLLVLTNKQLHQRWTNRLKISFAWSVYSNDNSFHSVVGSGFTMLDSDQRENRWLEKEEWEGGVPDSPFTCGNFPDGNSLRF